MYTNRDRVLVGLDRVMCGCRKLRGIVCFLTAVYNETRRSGLSEFHTVETDTEKNS